MNNKKLIGIFLFLISFYATSQEIIKEKEPEQKLAQQHKRQKIDGIIATVGDYTVLDSDIDKAFLEIQSSGGSTKDITRCQML